MSSVLENYFLFFLEIRKIIIDFLSIRKQKRWRVILFGVGGSLWKIVRSRAMLRRSRTKRMKLYFHFIWAGCVVREEISLRTLSGIFLCTIFFIWDRFILPCECLIVILRSKETKLLWSRILGDIGLAIFVGNLLVADRRISSVLIMNVWSSFWKVWMACLVVLILCLPQMRILR